MRAITRLGITVLTGVGAALVVPTAALAAPLPQPDAAGDPVELTLMATTDVHGHVYDWDYFQNAPYPAGDSLGLARVSTAVNEVRAEKGAESVVVLDNGDATQGTPLTYYFGLGDGAAGVLAGTTTHPMAEAFNTVGYDAQTVGNHEFNYGLDMLSAYEDDLADPLLGANVIDVATGEPYLDPYTLIEREIDGQPITIGVIGLVTPGVRIWDKQYVDGVLEFQDLVEAAAEWVPVVDELADVVVVLAHTGIGTTPDQAYDPSVLTEDAVNNIAYQVPGIDVIVGGHTHQDNPSVVYTNVAGEPVLMTQPDYWARSVSEVTLNLVPDGAGSYQVDWTDAAAPTVEPHYGADNAEDPVVLEALAEQHATTVAYVNTPVAQSVTELSAATSRYEDTPIIDFINNVQSETVSQALVGTPYAGIPVISQASPFSRTAVFPEGEVTIRDIAGLYIYENTLRGVQLTGSELKDYLEYSARYFAQVPVGAVFDPATGTNAVYPDRPTGVPDYNYDAISGVDYYIDISQPVGSRIGALSFADGTPVAPDDSFILAVNNYRQSGGGSFPAVAAAPVVYDELVEIRQALIDWASARGVIDPADFFVQNWSLVTAPVEVDPSPLPTPLPTPAPTPDPEAAGQLPATGADPAGAALIAGLLLMVGAGIRLSSRRSAERRRI